MNFNKLKLYLIIYLIFLITYIISSQKITYSKQLKIAGSSEWFPISFYDHNSEKQAGIAIDLITTICKDLKIDTTIFNNLPWDRIINLLDINKIDVIAGNYWTQERNQKYLITNSFYNDKISIFVNINKKISFSRWNDLKPYIGGVPSFGKGSYGEKFDKYAQKHLKIERLNNKKTLFMMLARERIDYIILAYWDGLIYLKKNNIRYIIILPKNLISNTVHFSISKKSSFAKLLPLINEKIILYQNNGTLNKIIKKYNMNRVIKSLK